MLKPEVQNAITWLGNKLAEGYLYKNWSNEFVRSEFDKAFDIFYKEMTKDIDIATLTKEDLHELRFRKWDDESDLMLVPLWMVPLIPDKMEVETIGGTKMMAGEAKKDIDIRFGCVAWGIYPHPET